MKTPDASATYDATSINKLFRNFYETLYKSQVTAGQSDIVEFLDRIPLSTISDEDRTSLDSPLLPEEVFSRKSL